MSIALLKQRVTEWQRHAYAFKKPPYTMKMLVEVRATHHNILTVASELLDLLEDNRNDAARVQSILDLNHEIKVLLSQYNVLRQCIEEALAQKRTGT